MFRLVPRDRQGWFKPLLFPFQMYVVLAFIAYVYLFVVWPRRIAMDKLNTYFSYGDLLCSLILGFAAFAQIISGRRRSSFINFGLGFISALLGVCLPNQISL